jgi:hypothetical protein
VKIIIRTYRFGEPGGVMTLVREQHFGDFVEALRAWLSAQLDFNIDRIKVQVDKGPR